MEKAFFYDTEWGTVRNNAEMDEYLFNNQDDREDVFAYYDYLTMAELINNYLIPTERKIIIEKSVKIESVGSLLEFDDNLLVVKMPNGEIKPFTHDNLQPLIIPFIEQHEKTIDEQRFSKEQCSGQDFVDMFHEYFRTLEFFIQDDKGLHPIAL